MAASLFSGLLFVILPHLNLGLLSDYKICGDSECESKSSTTASLALAYIIFACLDLIFKAFVVMMFFIHLISV